MSPDDQNVDRYSRPLASGSDGSPALSVLQIVNSPEPGGVLSLSTSIAAGLNKEGHEVETAFVAPDVGMSWLAKLSGCLRIARQLLSGRYDAVIAYQGAGAITVALTALASSPPRRIVHQTTQPAGTAASVRKIDWALGSLGLYQVNVVNTASTQSHFAKYPESYRKSLVLIEHGVAIPDAIPPREDVLARFGLPLAAPILLSTGRLVADKNQAVLIRALVDVPRAHLVIAGGGELEGAYKELAHELGVADRVHLLGALPWIDAVELTGAADLFLFPTLHETFGISAVEAVMLGKPALVSDIAVLREVLTSNGHTEVAFIQPHDSPAWARAINSFLQNPTNPIALEDFAGRIRSKYSEDRMIRQYVDLLARLAP